MYNGPFSLGMDLAYVEYGGTTRKVSLGRLIPEVPDAVVKVNTDNRMLLVHARGRAQRQRGRWRPYADVLLGVGDLFTRSSITGVADCSTASKGAGCVDTSAASATNARDTVLSYGGGGGVQFGFWSKPVWFDVSVRYLRGGRARYLTEGDLHVEGDRTVLTLRESQTNMTAFYWGVAVGR
jgi:hypothetical protein